MLSKKDVVKYYIAMFNRIPEKEAVDRWYSIAIKNGWNEKELVNNLFKAAINVVNSNEDLQTLYPQYVNYDPNDLISNRKIIESVYKSLFDKDYQDDPIGIDNWAKKIVNKNIDIGSAIVTISHFAEDVYNNKIDLTPFYSPNEIENIKKSVATFESRVDFANIVSNVIIDIDIDNYSLKVLEDDINLIHSQNDYFDAYKFLMNNLYNISDDSYIEKNLENLMPHQTDNITTEENLGFIDLPTHYETQIHQSYNIIE